MANMALCYYEIKYPYLFYPFRDEKGVSWFMFSVPVNILANLYKNHFNKMPLTFFDCGAAIGELIRQAEKLNIKATGIDIKRYPTNKFPSMYRYEKYFKSGQIQIKSILNCEPIRADLAYCNGTLTYMNETTLPLALEKFQNVGMLIAIHNTTEDINAARQMGEELLHDEPRLIRSNQWWIDTFKKHGFDTHFDERYNVFCAIPNKSKIK